MIFFSNCLHVQCILLTLSTHVFQIRRHWGGGVMGSKSQARIAKIEKAKAKEIAQKLG